MLVNCQFIYVAIIFSCYNVLANQNDSCDCDVLEIKSNGVIGNQNFTKQSLPLYDKPNYFSMQKNLIYWFKNSWIYAIHIDSEGFKQKQTYMYYFIIE